MSKEQQPIFPESAEAAKFVTGISGWVDRHGRFWGEDERTARFCGATHKHCRDCDITIDVGNILCPACYRKDKSEKYQQLKKQKWDGESYLYSDPADKFFASVTEIIEYIGENECSIEYLELVICDPQTLSSISDDYWIDDLPEDGELPDNVQAAVYALNKEISKSGIVSWYPGKFAAIVDLSESN